MPFRDREDAGRRLADRLEPFRSSDPVVIGLPRGGVVVAAEVARVLDAPLDVVVVRKLGAPGRPELGIGAIGEDGIRTLNQELINLLGVTGPELTEVEAQETDELARRVVAYRGNREPVAVAGRTIIVIDDGLATGYTARTALRVLRNRGAVRLILAVPVSARDTAKMLREEADQVIALELPHGFGAVGQWYSDFRQTSDEEVIRLLMNARSDEPPNQQDVWIPIENDRLPGILLVPSSPRGMVVFAHGSGSSRHSLRNQAVAGNLNAAGFGTLLFDLLTDEEAQDRANVFDIRLLANRLTSAIDWLGGLPAMPNVSIGLFGASTGAAAALLASIGMNIAAVVSRGGRPDLVGPRLPAVTTPVLLIIGSRDETVVELNRTAAAGLSGPCEISIVPGAGHLFEEPGALEDVAARAITWFARWLDPGGRA
ncbi:MAG: phosphoribosyltransferase family protein [Acidimicrobiia bacterium]|nr:phosphoribosyltransferase family protein [Acidimicrobiia bacterium]